MKVVALVSGGLDSILAIKIIKNMGADIIPLHIVTPFNSSCCSNLTLLTKILDDEGADLETVNAGKDYVEMVKKPKFGYGNAINPCRDCRIYMYRIAKEVMEKEGADFVISGEVLGQRPMSQNKKAMMLEEKEAGLKGLVLRPLSGKLLPVTVPENKGLVDRNEFFDIKGRSRKRQIELAKKYGLNEWPNSAGGCLLTDKKFSRKIKDIFKYKQSYNIDDLSLLKVGRQFRLSPNTKLIIGRNQTENQKLECFRKYALLFPDNFNGPTGLLDGSMDQTSLAASIIYAYSDKVDSPSIKIDYMGNVSYIKPDAVDRDFAKKYMI